EGINTETDKEIIVVYEKKAEINPEDILEDICQVEDTETIAKNMASEGKAELVTIDGDLDEAIEAMEDTPGVAFAQKNYTYTMLEADIEQDVNDP
ncbi:MAG: hypothetical protein Q4B78_02025, partial [Bacillota bacterium]|nr:hypothetical protein [Bacillota bacterium]